MKRLFINSCVAAALALMTGGAYADCGLTGTNALSVQDNSGQGNFTCDGLATEGGDVVNLVDEVVIRDDGEGGVEVLDVAIVKKGTAGKTAQWEINPDLLDTDGNGLQDLAYKVFIVSAVNGGGGSSCNYLYDGGQTLSGDNLGDPSNGQIKLNQTLVCGDPDPVDVVEEEPEQDIISTQGDGCLVSVTVEAGDITETLTPDVISFFSYDDGTTGEEEYGVCSNLGGQLQCISDKETIARVVPTDCPKLTTNGFIDGVCAPIDTSQRETITLPDGTPFEKEPCWNLINRWCDLGNNPGRPWCSGRTAGDLPSFDPRTLVRATSSETQVWQGSPFCYLKQEVVRGVLKSYWVCIEI